MKIINFNKENLESLEYKNSYLIASSGTEERGIYFSKKLKKLGYLEFINKKVMGFNNWRMEGNRKSNDDFFKSNNFKIEIADGDEDKIIKKMLNNIIQDKNKEIKIIIDYSCMTRMWYSAVLDYFRNLNYDKIVTLYFCYSSAKFLGAPKKEFSNIYVGPLKGFSYLSVPTKPSALLINLGYEAKRAIGLKEYLDAETFIFYPTLEKRSIQYIKEIEDRNKEIIRRIKPGNIIRYPFYDLKQTYSILIDLCKDLREDFRIVIAPCGAKSFSLISLITSIKLNDIDVWRITAGKAPEPENRIADGEISILKLQFGL